MEISGILNSITNDSLEKHVLLIFENFGAVLEAMDFVVCHRLVKNNQIYYETVKPKGSLIYLRKKLFYMTTMRARTIIDVGKSSSIKVFSRTIKNFLVW